MINNSGNVIELVKSANFNVASDIFFHDPLQGLLNEFNDELNIDELDKIIEKKLVTDDSLLTVTNHLESQLNQFKDKLGRTKFYLQELEDGIRTCIK